MPLAFVGLLVAFVVVDRDVSDSAAEGGSLADDGDEGDAAALSAMLMSVAEAGLLAAEAEAASSVLLVSFETGDSAGERMLSVEGRGVERCSTLISYLACSRDFEPGNVMLLAKFCMKASLELEPP